MLFITIDSRMHLKNRSSVKAFMRDTVFPRRHLLATSSVLLVKLASQLVSIRLACNFSFPLGDRQTYLCLFNTYYYLIWTMFALNEIKYEAALWFWWAVCPNSQSWLTLLLLPVFDQMHIYACLVLTVSYVNVTLLIFLVIRLQIIGGFWGNLTELPEIYL